MRPVKPILCSVFCILTFSTLTAQLLLKKDSARNPVNENLYLGRQWSVKQILKDSVSYQYISIHDYSWPKSSHSSMIYLSIIEYPVAPVERSISEKLQLHLNKSLYCESTDYFHAMVSSCVNLSRWYKRPALGKFFFNYQ